MKSDEDFHSDMWQSSANWIQQYNFTFNLMKTGERQPKSVAGSIFTQPFKAFDKFECMVY